MFSHSRLRRDQSLLPLVADPDTATEAALQLDPQTPDTVTAAFMRAAFDGLPETFRLAILLVDVEELTYREAAATLDVPMGTVMSRLNRGPAGYDLIDAHMCPYHGRNQVFVVSDRDASPPPTIVNGLLRSTLAFVRTLER